MQNRIGIVIGKPYHTINRLQLQGILKECYHLGFSACVFSVNEEFYDEQVLTEEKNILNAMQFHQLDGVIYLPYTLTKEETRPDVTKYLLKNCQNPLVMVAAETEPFLNIWFDETSQFESIVTHLIEEHGCQDILCLTGFVHHKPSLNRADGWRNALKKAGLPVSEERLVYGDFWTDAPTKLAIELTNGTRSMPDAVVCANDRMAITLCDELEKRGVHVPEDVFVTGFDGIKETSLHIPSVTTCMTGWKELGRNAMRKLYAAITKTSQDIPETAECKLVLGESCGHHREEIRGEELNYETLESRYLDTSITSLLLSDGNVSSLFRSIYDTSYFFWDTNYAGHGDFRLCLCEDWNKTEFLQYSETYRTVNYSEQMLMTEPSGQTVVFPLAQMIPMQINSNQPSVTFFNPIYFRDRCFGYSLLRLDGIADSYDIYYLRFCREVSSALAFLCLQNDYRSLAFQNYIRGIRDELTGLYLFDRCPQMWEECISAAQLYGETLYVLAFCISGLQQIEDLNSRIEKDKIILAFSDILVRCCRGHEQVFLAEDGIFFIIGSELPPVSRPDKLRQNIKEQFQKSGVQTNHSFLYLSSGCEMFDTAAPLSLQDCNTALKKLITTLQSTEQPTYQTKQHYQRLSELRREIYTCPEREWSVEFCAKQMRMSQSYFLKVYRNAFGLGCSQDIQHSKLAYAKKLLLQTDMILQDIAEKCGYDYSHFMRQFKKEVGITPTAYRKGAKK